VLKASKYEALPKISFPISFVRVRPLEDHQLIGGRCKRGNTFS